MKKPFVSSLLVALLFATSCSKDNTSPAGSWAFKGVSYRAANAFFSTSNNSLTATSSSGSNPGTLTFFFPSMPTKSANYKVVNYTNLPLDSNQLYILFVNGISSYYYLSMGSDNVNANVSVSPTGKISVTVASASLKSYSSAITDSAQLSASINQQ